MKYHCPEMDQLDFSGLNREKYNGVDKSDLIRTMEEKIFNSMQEKFKPNHKHLIPLSGGYDSRAVLAMLMEFTEMDNISTYTFGIPKTYDYEIGNSIAEFCGTDHTTFNLKKHEFTIDNLLETSRLFQHQTLLFFHPPYHLIEKKYAQHDVWSGWMADFLSGFQCESEINFLQTKEQTIDWYVRFCTMVRSTSLMKGDENSYLPYWTWNRDYEDKLRWDDNIVIYNRQLKYTRPQLLVGDLNYVTPFFEPDVYNFFLSLPDRFRCKQYLYKQFLTKRFPSFFSLPTKKNFGVPIRNSAKIKRLRMNIVRINRFLNRFFPFVTDPMLNYHDFRHKLRMDKNLKILIYELICNLENRKILDWVNFQKLWLEHQGKKADHSYALLVLASLEIHLMAGLKL